MGTTRIVFLLLHMVASLQDRCRTLEDQRSRQLTEYQQRLQQTEDRLLRARRQREETEDLRIAAQQLAEQHRRALEEGEQQVQHSDPELTAPQSEAA